ncbi:hypothetical protein CKAH01_19091 [Colletotrichum kahawae]|uniref:Uncharacterized protein n=1 Tax=Colletotrichum kahawae TaxID=34407 RepID=A0AAD9XYR6_COLKA|nr:hypothetical protein CKAH01_19091 [Colletotrichum kahawae]
MVNPRAMRWKVGSFVSSFGMLSCPLIKRYERGSREETGSPDLVHSFWLLLAF